MSARYARMLVTGALALVLVAMATVTSPGRARAAPAPRTDYYLSLGDSYAAGYQPVTAAFDHRDPHGFAYQVVKLAGAEGIHLVLRNFGCDGATTRSMIRAAGCSQGAAGPDAASYPTQSQAAAADRFLSRHRGQVGLVTVSIGGNDIVGCGQAAHPVACFAAALPAVKKNLALLLTGLRRAAGPGVPVIGLTYPDVFLGLYPSASERADALLSVTEFRRLFNPVLHAAYAAVGATFADVTRATGAYTPLTDTTPTARYGTIPVAVADVCVLTYYCRLQDVHPTTAGYAVIAKLILRTWRPRPARGELGTEMHV